MRLQEHKIKLLRKAKGVSQKYISKITFTEPAKITKIERGLTRLRLFVRPLLKRIVLV